MKTETRMFFDAMLRGNRPISEFITARYTFLNEPLARFYGIDGVTGNEFRRVDLTTDERGGVLGHGSVLAVSSYPTRTSVVIRGKYILQNILGTPPPPPPADVPALDEEALGTSATLRQQMEKHRTNAICASCHSRMDPLGFALENYDAIGKWRTQDGTFAVDCERRAAERQVVQQPRRDAGDPRRHAAGAVARADREAADLQPRPRSPALRPADRARHQQEGGGRPATASRRSCAKSFAACRSSRGGRKRRRCEQSASTIDNRQSESAIANTSAIG